ncbi:hypothetical protein PPYR_11231 [Photinus pyralis]|uniref:Uncharacterized protein n=1 Tax=Photinus pyralis TaxID=7054 RepID=A0A5N4AAP1_PHOPY|nr:uncharacterized protein LOC116175741 [Photinus pyralis]KAB0794392.1 hypothetical protein PPYR_11231 [Photinus pyralis]
MGTVILLIVASFVLAQSSPISHKLKYNQSQEGVWNIRADLENFLIFIIPTSRGSGAHHNASLLDFLSKTVPMSRHRNRHENTATEDPNKSVETEQFIESKTAPYHVDISQARRHLAKLHPELNVKDDVIQSGSVSLSKLQNRAIRSARAFIVRVPMENQNVLAYNHKETKEEFKKGSGDKPKLEIKFEDLSPELKTTYANILADVIKTGLKEYFRKVAVDLEESHHEEDDDEVPLKVRKEEKKKMVEKIKKKKEGVPNSELEPPKAESVEKSETPKKTLI